MPIQVQIITAFLVLRDRMDDAWRRVREDRGELTGSVIRTLGPLIPTGRVLESEPPRDGLHRRLIAVQCASAGNHGKNGGCTRCGNARASRQFGVIRVVDASPIAG